MKHRPTALFVCALILSYFPLSMVWDWWHGGALSYTELAVSGVLPLLCIIGLLRVTTVGWYTLIAMVAIGGIHDLHEYYSGSEGEVGSLLLHLAIYCVSLGYFINPRIRHLYFDPKLRWWRAKPRYETHLPFLFRHDAEWQYPILRNISEGGCFIETNHLMEVGARIEMTIPLPVPLAVSVIRTHGEVRWVSTNPLRTGMGVQFQAPEPLHAKALREYVHRQL